MENFGGYKTEVKKRAEERERLALRNEEKEENHLEIYGRLRKDIGMKYLHGPMHYAKKLALRFRVGDLDRRPERRKIYTSNREEEDVATNRCLCEQVSVWHNNRE